MHALLENRKILSGNRAHRAKSLKKFAGNWLCSSSLQNIGNISLQEKSSNFLTFLVRSLLQCVTSPKERL